MRLDAVRTVVYPKGTGGMDMNLCMKQKVFRGATGLPSGTRTGTTATMYAARCFRSAKAASDRHDRRGGRLHPAEGVFVQAALLCVHERCFAGRDRQGLHLFTSRTTAWRAWDWEVNGNFGAHDYEISGARGTVASVHKQWFTWGDCYEICISENENEQLVLAVVLAIDA